MSQTELIRIYVNTKIADNHLQYLAIIFFAISAVLLFIYGLKHLLSGGLTGVSVYKIAVENHSYAIKLENVQDTRFDLSHSYQILETVSNWIFS